MVKIVVVAVLVAVVILTECMFAYLLIPSRTDLEKWANAKAAQAGHGEPGGHAQAKKHSEHPEIEVDLGKYNVVVHQPTANVSLRVSFHLIGTVSEKEHAEFEHLLEAN